MEEKDKINTKDIHATFWRCRDFELANLWQRSVFLTAFLVLCFTVYGAILIKLFDYSNEKQLEFILINLLAFVLALFGIIFSIMWIKMGKGSKAWYEVYEHAISAIETNTDYATEAASKIGGFSYNQLEDYENINKNNSIFSTKAGAYSVSKINIAIGQVFFAIWMLAGIIHLCIGSIKLNCYTNSCFIGIIAVSIGLSVLISIVFLFGRSKMFQSSSIK